MERFPGDGEENPAAIRHLRTIRFESRAGEAVPEEEIFDAYRNVYSTDPEDPGSVTNGETEVTEAIPDAEALQRARDAVREACAVPQRPDKKSSPLPRTRINGREGMIL